MVHKLSHKEEVLYSCNECSFASTQKRHFNRHMMLVHNFNKGTTAVHEKTQDDDKYYCDLCSFTGIDNRALLLHKKSHQENDEASGSNAKNSKTTPTEPKRKRGKRCSVRKAELKLIKEFVNDEGKKAYQCRYCDKVLLNKYNMAAHETNHTGDLRMKCNLCPYQTNKRIHLERHLAKHTGLTPYSCDKCDKKFAHMYDLKAHALVHGEKKWACDQCSFVTHRECNLKDHMLTHTDGPRYGCTECAYVCKQKQSLTTHMSTHTGVYRHYCDYCSYKTSNKSLFDQHMTKHKSKTAKASDTFVKSIASKLKNMPDSIREQTEQLLADLLMKAEQGKIKKTEKMEEEDADEPDNGDDSDNSDDNESDDDSDDKGNGDIERTYKTEIHNGQMN